MADPGFGLYVHWPFCQAKCPYCDFNSHVSANVEHDLWRAALIADLERYADQTGGRRLDSIFFGGGTPSLMDPKTVEAVISAAQTIWQFSNDIEITMEANPTSVEAGRFKSYSLAGVNRVSVGVQALNDNDLKALGRLHTSSEALTALDVARSVFDRTSFDLICARQGQSLSDWQSELELALSLGGDHLSLYQLTIEPGTAFGDRFAAGKLRGLPDQDLQADMYEMTQMLCGAAGLPAYEVSNHAPAGSESRHNLIYWRGGDWVGVGPGAHGRITLSDGRYSTESVRLPSAWLAGPDKTQDHTKFRKMETIEVEEEYLMMALRLSEGMDLSRVPSLNLNESIQSLTEIEMIDVSEGRLIATKAGRPVLNSIIKEFLTAGA